MSQTEGTGKPGNLLTRVWSFLRHPSATISLGVLIIVGGIGGILFWGGLHWAIEASNTETFCISCHEMRDNVYAEYRESVHYMNGSGVRAVCTDCHVPKQWAYKMARKIRATNELYHTVVGSISTKEKFEAKRLELAEVVWKTMKKTDSRECRNCHATDFMDFDKQASRAADRHEDGFDDGKTCIDCHKGIAHHLPNGTFDKEATTGQESQPDGDRVSLLGSEEETAE